MSGMTLNYYYWEVVMPCFTVNTILDEIDNGYEANRELMYAITEHRHKHTCSQCSLKQIIDHQNWSRISCPGICGGPTPQR